LRVNPLWYVAALMGPLVVFALAGLIESLRADHGLALRAQPFVVLIGSFLTNLVLNVWEEIGWRGFALRRVLSHVLLLPASLIVGLAWGIWHVPLFLMPGSAFSNAPFLVWIIGLIALSVLYAALYTGSKQSLFLVTLFHAGINTVGGLLYTGTYVSATLASVLLAVVVLVVTWHKWGRRPRGLDPAAGRQTASAPGSPLR
jgi:membrane protease YdiL (CAAX protease family)